MFHYGENRSRADRMDLKTGDGMRTLAIVLNSIACVLSIATIMISVKSIMDKEIYKDEERGGKYA